MINTEEKKEVTQPISKYIKRHSVLKHMSFSKRGGTDISVVPHILVVDLGHREILFMHASVQENKFEMFKEYLDSSKFGSLYNSNVEETEIHNVPDDNFFYRYNAKAFQGLTDMGSKPYIYEKEEIGDIVTFTATSENISPSTVHLTDFRKSQTIKKSSGIEPLARVPKNIRHLAMCWGDNDVFDELYQIIYNNYGTPFVKEWTPYIVDKLKKEMLIRECGVMTFKESNSINLRAFVLEFSEEKLQQVISEGIKNMELSFFEYDDMGDYEDEHKLLETNSVASYMTSFGPELAKIIQDSVQIRFDPTVDRHHPSLTELNLHANNQGVTGYYPPQANTIMGVAKTLKESNFCFVNGEMGKILPSIGESR